MGKKVSAPFPKYYYFNRLAVQIQISNYLFQILKLHMVLFKLEMIQAINKLFYTEKKNNNNNNNPNKSNTIKLL